MPVANRLQIPHIPWIETWLSPSSISNFWKSFLLVKKTNVPITPIRIPASLVTFPHGAEILTRPARKHPSKVSGSYIFISSGLPSRIETMGRAMKIQIVPADPAKNVTSTILAGPLVTCSSTEAFKIEYSLCDKKISWWVLHTLRNINIVIVNTFPQTAIVIMEASLS